MVRGTHALRTCPRELRHGRLGKPVECEAALGRIGPQRIKRIVLARKRHVDRLQVAQSILELVNRRLRTQPREHRRRWQRIPGAERLAPTHAAWTSTPRWHI